MSIKRLWMGLAISFFILPAPTSSAIVFGHIRGLQKGAVGDSPQFHEFGKYEGEAATRLYRSFGSYKVNNNADSKVSGSLFQTTLAAGGGMAASKNFSLSGFVDFTLASDFDLERQRTAPEITSDAGLYRHEVSGFGVFRSGGIVAGGGLGLLIIGSEDREFLYETSAEVSPYLSKVSSAAMPLVRLFGGFESKQMIATLGVRFFSQGQAVVEAEDPTGETYEYDIARRSPGEIHADDKLLLSKEAAVVGGFAYVLSGQASDHLDEYSMTFTGTEQQKVRQTGNGRRNADHVRVTGGGLFTPTKMIDLKAGLTYITASYDEPQYASMEHQNLGGLRLDVGGDVTMQEFRGFFQAGYTVDQAVDYRVEGNRRAAANIQQTQTPPLEDGDKVKMTQGNWQVVIGGGMIL